jgi:DNA-nicking Smr family endonuclease
MNTDHPDPDANAPVEIPIEGVLDLHTFRPKDAKVVVLEYLAACQEKGILKIRVIHGKGIGQLRQTVHALLEKHPEVSSYVLASEPFGGWGATIVTLRPRRPEAG